MIYFTSPKKQLSFPMVHGTLLVFLGPFPKPQAPFPKPQAPFPKPQASFPKPQASFPMVQASLPMMQTSLPMAPAAFPMFQMASRMVRGISRDLGPWSRRARRTTRRSRTLSRKSETAAGVAGATSGETHGRKPDLAAKQRVGQPFQAAGSAGFPVRRTNRGLESSQNRQAGKSARRDRGSWIGCGGASYNGGALRGGVFARICWSHAAETSVVGLKRSELA